MLEGGCWTRGDDGGDAVRIEEIGNATLINADCRVAMRAMDENSIDAIVTDPPYGLNFMGKGWDHGVPDKEFWVEALRVAKPGAHLLAFGGTRMFHRLMVAIEDAGWEIRDTIMWVYGCLDEATEVATKNGVMPYHKTAVGDRVLCYDVEHNEYSYQPILEAVEYGYDDTAYRLIGDFGEQIVSRNHRCIVERSGVEVFEFAEALQREARVPFLESLPALQYALHDTQQGASVAEQDLRQTVCGSDDRGCQLSTNTSGTAQREDDSVRGVQQRGMEAVRTTEKNHNPDMQLPMQRGATRGGVGGARLQGQGMLDGGIGGISAGTDDRGDEPCMERGADVPESKGCVCEPANQVRAMPGSDAADGTKRWVRDRVSTGCGDGYWAPSDTSGNGASSEPQRDGQRTNEPDAIQYERTAQGVRAWAGHKTTLVRVVPFHYTGKVWCLRVSTGAFVAVRNGVAFPTGNSGFPKSLDVSKAIDKAAGAEREVVGEKIRGDVQKAKTSGVTMAAADANKNNTAIFGYGIEKLTTPSTEAAKQWQGWGTALKPAYEPIIVARKPLAGTVAVNVQAWGTGAINIDGCRVGDELLPAQTAGQAQLGTFIRHDMTTPERTGRWPANLIHDGSDEALALFPDSGGSAARFFYCTKASKKDRNEGCDALPLRQPTHGAGHEPGGLNVSDSKIPNNNHHPTVKPTDLMRYLCRLVTPPGGTVLDPFMGSGSTGKAALREGFGFVGVDNDKEHGYFDIACARVKAATLPE